MRLESMAFILERTSAAQRIEPSLIISGLHRILGRNRKCTASLPIKAKVNSAEDAVEKVYAVQLKAMKRICGRPQSAIPEKLLEKPRTIVFGGLRIKPIALAGLSTSSEPCQILCNQCYSLRFVHARAWFDSFHSLQSPCPVLLSTGPV